MKLSDRKMLIVEDDPDIRQDIETYFRDNCGALVTSAKNGKEGFELFSKNPNDFEIVLSDLNMEPMDGLGMIDQIKSAFPDTSAIFAILSTEKNKAHRSRSKELGIRFWMLKPFDGDSLVETLSLYLERNSA